MDKDKIKRIPFTEMELLMIASWFGYADFENQVDDPEDKRLYEKITKYIKKFEGEE